MEDLRKQLIAFQAFAREVMRDLDRLSVEQREILRSALQRIETEQIAKVRGSLRTP